MSGLLSLGRYICFSPSRLLSLLDR